MMRRVAAAVVVSLVLGGVAMAIEHGLGHGSERRLATGGLATKAPAVSGSKAGPIASTGPPSPSPRRSGPGRSAGPLVLAGCPPPARPPGPPPPPPWHPAVLVPDAALPRPQAPVAWDSDVRPIAGKGMWVWQFDQTEGGNAEAIVGRAVRAGLRQLWVRVGSSKNGFYAAADLDALVGPAHAAGLAVIGWGFPYLYDPIRDARWTARALHWQGPEGDRLDGFSADIEKATEGVALSRRRVAVYLAAVRRAAGDRLVVATVYRPTDLNWTGGYPYRTIARYVDAFAPMVYWGCTDPRGATAQAVERLATLRPVHLIGQAYNMADEGGRSASPSAREIRLFLHVGRRGGALGASFWDWQEMTAGEWNAMAAYSWRVRQVPSERMRERV
jgi:hypothetical protein